MKQTTNIKEIANSMETGKLTTKIKLKIEIMEIITNRFPHNIALFLFVRGEIDEFSFSKLSLLYSILKDVETVTQCHGPH